MHRWIIFVTISCNAIYADSPIVSGDYDRIVLATDGDLVTGYFRDCTGECKFQCDVFFEGKREGNRFPIVAYYPGDSRAIPGELFPDGKKLRLKLKESPDGCWNVEPEFARAGAEVLLNAALPWLQVRVLRADAPLRGQSGTIEKGQSIVVLKKSDDWFLVQIPGRKGIGGWINSRHLYPLKTPATRGH